MASPVADSYITVSGGQIAGGRSLIRPVLGVIGNSKTNYEITPDNGFGTYAYATHKWMNALLRKPFDYVLCNVPASTMGPGWASSPLVNGFYGRGGAGAAAILGNTPPGVPTYIDQMEELIGSRRALICIEAEGNTLYAGTSAASGHACWAIYEDMIDLFAAKGWKVAVNEPCPSVSYNTAGNNEAAAAFRDDCIAADMDGTAINLTGMWNSFHDPANANGYLQPLSGYTLDGAHLNMPGALKRAIAFADAFPSGLYAPWKPLASDVVCSRNPTLSGTSGTLGDNASGVVPDYYTLAGYGASRTLAGAQTDDGYELTCNYTGGNYTDSYTWELTASNYLSNVTPGVTTLEALCDVEILENENFGVQLVGSTGVAGASSPAMATDSTIPWDEWLVGRRLVLHSDPFVAPSGITKSTASFRVKPISFSSSAHIKVRIRWLGMKQTG